MTERAESGSAISSQPLVHVLDDDQGVRSALADLLASVGYEVETYGSANEFLARRRDGWPSCLLLDVRLPGMNGLDFQEQLKRTREDLPIILMSGHADIPMSVRGIKSGALDFIEKPFREQDMLDAIALALEESQRMAPRLRLRAELSKRYERLTPRERVVLGLVVEGKLNKQIAYELSITEVTVKFHRATAMRKMEARSIAEVARMAEILGL